MDPIIEDARKQCGNWDEGIGCCLDENPEECPYFDECSSEGKDPVGAVVEAG